MPSWGRWGYGQKVRERRWKEPVLVKHLHVEGMCRYIETTTVWQSHSRSGGVIDARYELRVPTHLELKKWGSSLMNVMGQIWQTLSLLRCLTLLV